MKKLKKWIVALILGLFCGIGLIFSNSVVKADDNLTNYEVLTDINYTFDDNFSYYRINYDLRNLQNIINFDIYNLYGYYFSYSIDDTIYDFVSYFSYYRSQSNSLIGMFLYYYNNSYNDVSNTTASYIINLNTTSYISFNSMSKSNNNFNVISFQLIKFPTVIYNQEDLDNAYNEGYEDAREEVILKGSPLLNSQILVYDSDNILLGSEPINNNLISADSRLPSGTLYDYATDYLNSQEAGRIQIVFSNEITPNDSLQEIVNFTNGSFISNNLTSYSWVSSNGFILEQNLSNASKVVQDISLDPNLALVNFTFNSVDDIQYLEYGVVSSYYDTIYKNGYDLGYNNGYNLGTNQGKDEGYNLGYDVGYNEGLSQDFSFGRELLKVASVPFNVLSQILSFQIFDINVWLLLCGILTIVIVIWVIKKFRG